MTNTKIEKTVEEFGEKWMIHIDEGGFMKEDCRGIELYILKNWLRKALLTAHQQGKKDRDEEVMEWIKKNIGNTGDEELIDKGYDFALDDLKTFINQNNEK